MGAPSPVKAAPAGVRAHRPQQQDHEREAERLDPVVLLADVKGVGVGEPDQEAEAELQALDADGDAGQRHQSREEERPQRAGRQADPDQTEEEEADQQDLRDLASALEGGEAAAGHGPAGSESPSTRSWPASAQSFSNHRSSSSSSVHPRQPFSS